MTITCPHCGYSRQTASQRIPPGASRITCPQCRQRFPFSEAKEESPAEGTETWLGDRQEFEQPNPDEAFPAHWDQPPSPRPESQEATEEWSSADSELMAGFWVRAIAAIVDSVLVTMVQVVLGFAFGIAAGALGALHGDDAAMAFTAWLFGTALAVAYYVFFTGYCGQTPGKMALRVKVIRTDGSDIGYWRAALREVPGKFLSGILFGIGYLMVAFDPKKQGLHDKIADTYVIKL